MPEMHSFAMNLLLILQYTLLTPIFDNTVFMTSLKNVSVVAFS